MAEERRFRDDLRWSGDRGSEGHRRRDDATDCCDARHDGCPASSAAFESDGLCQPEHSTQRKGCLKRRKLFASRAQVPSNPEICYRVGELGVSRICPQISLFPTGMLTHARRSSGSRTSFRSGTAPRALDLGRGESFGFLGFDFRRVRSRRGAWCAQYTPKLKKRTALCESSRTFSAATNRSLWIGSFSLSIRCFAVGWPTLRWETPASASAS
jgi:hypothetical protein